MKPKRIRVSEAAATITQSRIPCKIGRTPTCSRSTLDIPVPIKYRRDGQTRFAQCAEFGIHLAGNGK